MRRARRARVGTPPQRCSNPASRPFPSPNTLYPCVQVGVDLSQWPAIAEYNKAVEAIPAVGAARGAMFAASPKA